MKSTLLVPMVLIALTIVGCSSDDPATTDSGSTSSSVAASSTSSAPSSTTTTTIPVTTAAPTSTSTSTTSTTSSTTTSTTLAPGAELILRPNGLGDAAFGADPDGVIAYVSSIIGASTVDSGWVDPLSGGSCTSTGTELRTVTWGDLQLFFSDESIVTSGRRHFLSYVYGPTFGAEIAPAGLKTEAGIGVGSTVADLTGTYPTATIIPANDFGGPNFLINEGLAGFLTGVNPTDTVTSMLGGQGCGE